MKTKLIKSHMRNKDVAPHQWQSLRSKLVAAGCRVALIAATFVFFSCSNLTSVTPRKALKNGERAGSAVSDLKLTALFRSVNESYIDPVAFENAPHDLYYTLTVNADDMTVWINPELNVSGIPITYQTQDTLSNVTGEMIETAGMIKLDVTTTPEVLLFVYIGSKTYTIKIIKNSPVGVVYVSPSGDGSDNDLDNEHGQRGLTPSTAFYSLYEAVKKATGPGDYNRVVVLGVLKRDRFLEESSGDTGSVFQILSTNNKELIISGGRAGQYISVSPGLSAEGSGDAGGIAKRVLTVSGGSHVELRGLTISGSGKKSETEKYTSFRDEGAGILASGADTIVRLRSVDVTGNTAAQKGGGVYIDGAAFEIGSSTQIYENESIGITYGNSVYFNSGKLIFSGDGAALKTDTNNAYAINDATLGKVPDTVFVADGNTITASVAAAPLFESTTYRGLAAYIVLATENYEDGQQVVQGDGITGELENTKFMRFRSYGGLRLWAIDKDGKLAASESYYVKDSKGNDYYDGLSEDTAFNSLECALSYANAAKNQSSYVNRKLTVLSKLSASNHAKPRYPGILSKALTNGTTFDITFDGKTPKENVQNPVLLDAPELLCNVDIVITAKSKTLPFACNFTDAKLTFKDITLSKSTYKNSSVYGERDVGTEELVFSDDVKAGGYFGGNITVATVDKPVVFKRVLDNGSTKYFSGGKVAVNAGELRLMGTVNELTVNGGLVTDEDNKDVDDSVFKVVLSKGGKLIVKNLFLGLICKYPAGEISFEGGYVPDGGGNYGIVLREYEDDKDKVSDDARKAIVTRAPAIYFGASSPSAYIAKIYLDDGAPNLRGYKIFDFANLVSSGSDAAAFGSRSLTNVVAKYNLSTSSVYEWEVGTTTANTKTLGLLGRKFVVGDIINHEKTYRHPSGNAPPDDNWKPSTNDLVITEKSVIYKIDSDGRTHKAMYWGLLKDKHDPSDHDVTELTGHDWYYKTGDAVRKDVMDGSKIPGGTDYESGHWVLPREQPSENGETKREGNNNIGSTEWSIIVTKLGVPAPSHKIRGYTAFWAEASMGPVLSFAAIGGTALVVLGGGLIAFLILNSYNPVAGIALAALLGIIAKGVALGMTVGAVLGAVFMGLPIIEMVYKPDVNDYERVNDNDDYFPTIVIQYFSNYVCYDPDPVHAQ